MSLATRLTAFAQAVGADIKSLRTDVTALGASSAKGLMFYVGAAQNLGNGNPVNWTGEVVDTENVRNADLTEITLPAGTWWVEASTRPDTSITAGAYIQALLQVDGVTRSEGIGIQQSGATSPRAVVPGVLVVSNGTTKIRLLIYCTTSGSVYPSIVGISGTNITASVIGGTRGPAGSAGPPGAIPVYEQSTEPVTDEIGAIWIKG